MQQIEQVVFAVPLGLLENPRLAVTLAIAVSLAALVWAIGYARSGPISVEHEQELRLIRTEARKAWWIASGIAIACLVLVFSVLLLTGW